METFQQPKIVGYRQLSVEEAVLMNQIKQKAAEVDQLCEQLRGTATLDQRWISIGWTDLQKGFMSLVRGVHTTTSF